MAFIVNQLPSDRLLHKIFVTDKKLFYKGSKSWISCINETEKILGIQNLEKRFYWQIENLLQEQARQKYGKH